jgi:hypothetical protein
MMSESALSFSVTHRASVLHVPRPSHRFGGDWVTNEEVVSGVIFC